MLAHLHSVCPLIAQVQRLFGVSDVFIDDLIDLHGDSIDIAWGTYLSRKVSQEFCNDMVWCSYLFDLHEQATSGTIEGIEDWLDSCDKMTEHDDIVQALLCRLERRMKRFDDKL